jgi:glycosyltransferase involved in cell wall biosynthesis
MTALQLLGSANDGGAEAYFLALIEALYADGFAQACAIREHPGRERRLAELGMPTRVLPFGGMFDFTTRPALARFARDQDARVLIAWMSRAAQFAPPGPWARIGRLGGYYKLRNFKGFDLLVANTEDIAAWIVRQGWPAQKVRCIPNFATAGEAEPVDRASLDTPADALLLLGLGRLHPSKAHDVSLKAVARLPDAWLWIAGSGPLEAELKSLARELGVADRVRFLGWRDDAPALYRAADVCLFPSRFEPLGNVVIQAWAHGLPIVAAASQGPGALIHDQVDGLLVPVDDDEALASAAQRLLTDAGLRSRLAEAGAARIAAEFSQGRIVARWRDVLRPYEAA